MATQNAATNAAAPIAGGTVEPASRAAAKDRAPTSREKPGERYELRDPFADATYRSSSFDEITAKAVELGASRLTAIAADGKRTPVNLIDGQWQRGQQLAALPETRPDLHPKRESMQPALASAPHGPMAGAPGERKDLAKAEAEAEQAALRIKLQAALGERYVIKRPQLAVGSMTVGNTEYRFRGDTSRIAFTESTFRLATDTNSPSVARSMVDVAQARDWRGVRVAGSDEFRRLVWLEASVRGFKALGYEPSHDDLEALKREREARQANRIEPMPAANDASPSSATEKASARGSGGRKAVVAAIEAVLIARRVPEARRSAVMAAVNDKLAERLKAGLVHTVKVFDKGAPSQQRHTAPALEPARSPERQLHAHAR